MKKEAPSRCYAVILGCLCLFVSQITHALLIETDVYWADDKLLTVDTRTGLEWLDLTPTDGFSINEAMVSPWVTELGFRVANAQDVDSLLESAGLAADVFDPSQTAPEAISWFPGTTTMVREAYFTLSRLLGTTLVESFIFSTHSEADGLFLGMSGPNGVGLNINSHTSDRAFSTTFLRYDTQWDGFGFDGASEDYGVYLVRDTASVPVPNPLLLLLTGLVALRFSYKRRLDSSTAR